MPLIGISPSWDNRMLLINQDYVDAVLRAGGVPVILPLKDSETEVRSILEHIDGIVFSGGGDVDPSRYGEERMDCCGESCQVRDDAEYAYLAEAMRRDLPILAICRGIQVLNAFLGGTLYQDIATQKPGSLTHPRSDTPRDPVHEVRIEKDSVLYRLTGAETLAVNSRHHQAIKEPGKGLRITSWATDGIPEGTEMTDRRFVVGVQWHPESLSDRYPAHQAIFDGLAAACAQRG